MKHLILLISVLLFSTFQLQAQSANAKTETFKVYGNCGMCKRTIEKAATSVDGVKTASWDMETEMMTVSYDNPLNSSDAIKLSIANSGYDTETHRATAEAYNKLHGCCQYDRPAAIKTKRKKD